MESKKKLEDIKTSKDANDRLFFHDLINLTHGILLYLNQKSSSGSVISNNEIDLIKNEVYSIQSLIKDHFNYNHKNLSDTYLWVPFSVGEIALNKLIQNYFPTGQKKIFIRLEGEISYDMSLDVRERAKIYYPIFYRIVNNLVKNIAEANSSEVTIKFKYEHSLLTIESTNTFSISSRTLKIVDQANLNVVGPQSSLSSKEDEANIQSLGLLSIEKLARDSGGGFSFQLEDGNFKCTITLPMAESLMPPKKAS